MRINTGPPALFTLWLSMAQAVGLASRSAFSAFDVQCMIDLDTRGLPAQGEQRRSFYFNIRRDILSTADFYCIDTHVLLL